MPAATAAAATLTAGAHQSLPLRPQSPIHRRPPPLEPWPDFSAFPKCSSSSLGRHFFYPSPPLWLIGVFLSNYCTRPISILLLSDHGLTSSAFLEVQLFHFISQLPLLLPTATAVVADRSLPLRSMYPTHHRPPPPGPRPDFPRVSRSATLLLHLPAATSSTHCRHCHWRLFGQPEPSSLITVPDLSPSSTSQTTA